ncbi:hypothetical protein H8S95_03120 [Pontibacter sp. KCTC 32443]|uniref:hypothetical protein n=1 Tax=Pontibacter TaxID=323449 RepID=UPI00164EB433|nr:MULTISPECIES: hypothetical protein [Pontibacter]MBC5773043.1 hypothetical protein [Pontibacter sp. KCTC 32443]
MKKLLLLPLLAALSLTSCNDDDGESIPAPVSEVDADMRGDWTNTFVKREYISDRDTVMYADSANIQAFFKFDGVRMTVKLPNSNTTDVWNYSFPDADNPNYIKLTKGNETTDYIIKTLNDSVMVWEDEEAWAGFPADAPEAQQTTSQKGIYTYKFVRDK